MKIFATLVFFVLLLTSFEVFAGVDCGDFDCEDNELCIDRGQGNDCWQTCRTDFNCDSGCCIQIVSPFTAWICGSASECGNVDGDDDSDDDLDYDDEINVDGDTIEIEHSGHGGVCGDTECNSWQICIVMENGLEACAAVCQNHSECASGCCATIKSGEKICLSAGEECVSEVDGDSDAEQETEDKGCSDKGLFCESAGGSFIFGMLMLAWLVRYFARRKFN